MPRAVYRPWASANEIVECLRGTACPGGRRSTIMIEHSRNRSNTVPQASTRRDFIRDLGVGAAAVPFLLNLPGLGFANQARRKQRLVLMFSPNGVVQPNFWPDEEGAKFTLKESLQPLEPFRERTLIL